MPQGPFTVITQNVTSLAYTDVGDFGLFQDEDGQAYIIYTAHIQGYIVTHQVRHCDPHTQTALSRIDVR